MPASMSSRSPNGRLTCRYWITPSGGKSTSACAGKRSLGPRASVRRGINMEPAFVGLRCVCLSPSLIPASATCGGAASGCTPRRAIISKRVVGVNESLRSSLHVFGRLLASDAPRRSEVIWDYGGCPLRCYHPRRSSHITSFAVWGLPRRWAAQRHFCESTVPPRLFFGGRSAYEPERGKPIDSHASPHPRKREPRNVRLWRVMCQTVHVYNTNRKG